jgi:hypothetical protein
MLNLLLRVPNIVIWPFSKGSSSRIRAIGGIIIVANTKNKLQRIEVLVRC